MAERSLAHIEKIAWVKPIEGADNIELIGVLGWVCIAKKGEFKPEDICVYFEIDSKLPETEWSEFMRTKHFKVKTMKLGRFNVISQGLALPIESILELQNKTLKIGDDVTELLGVTYSVVEDNIRKSKNGDSNAKYKSMASRHKELFKKKPIRWLMKRDWGRKLLFLFFGKKKDNPKAFPEWIHKTDETRCLFRDTKIITDKGVLRIADIVNKRIGAKVLSYNYDRKCFEWQNINSYQKYKIGKEQLVEIEYPYVAGANKKNRIKCSYDHKFYIGNNEYKRAGELNVGDTIYILDNCFTDEIIPVVYGMLLGDSSIKNDKRHDGDCGLTINTSQGEKQLEYLKFKQTLFGIDNFKIRKGRSGYCNNVVYLSTLKTDHNIARHLKQDCYINGRKTITQSFVDKLTPISLALWYMDDGNLKHRSLEDSNSPNIILSTCGFSKEENELLIDCLKNKFNVDCNLRFEKNKYWNIYITTEGTKIFLKMISKYIPKSMKYKTLIEYENEFCVLDNKTYEKENILMPIQITNIKDVKMASYGYIYDIEVDNNHNFISNNILTHNCENMPWILESMEPWVKTEKLDGTSSTYALDLMNPKIKKGDFIVCSRNVRQKDEEQACYHECGNVYWEMADKYNIETVLRCIAIEFDAKRVVLQGEIYGLAVQGNPYKLKERRFAAFNLIIDGIRFDSVRAQNILKQFNIPFVPIIDTKYYLPKDMETFKLEADGKSLISDVPREGFVYRSLDGINSFKNVSREFLLKHS